MDNEVVLTLTFFLGYAPFRGGGVFEHVPRRCAGGAQCIVEVAHRAGTVSVLRTVLNVAGSLDYLHAFPVGFEFIGDDHRQPGTAAGSHLGAVRDNLDVAARFDSEIHRGLPDPTA